MCDVDRDAGGIEVNASDRVLVLAPHPDDEAVACAGLILHARERGAAVRIVYVTDGDNNPWPQRLLERRWRIDGAARGRWGTRRRGEARAALRELGLDDADASFLGWPDQYVTDAIVTDGAATSHVFVELVERHAPTVIAVPMFADTHPDHSAVRVLLDAALRRVGRPIVLLEYCVHGDAAPATAELSLSDAAIERKRRAVLSHASQLQFGERRLTRFVSSSERYVRSEFNIATNDIGPATAAPAQLACPARSLHEQRLLVAVVSAKREFHVASAALPTNGHAVALRANGYGVIGEARRIVDRDGAHFAIEMDRGIATDAYAKIERVNRGVWVFDRAGWAKLP